VRACKSLNPRADKVRASGDGLPGTLHHLSSDALFALFSNTSRVPETAFNEGHLKLKSGKRAPAEKQWPSGSLRRAINMGDPIVVIIPS